MIADPVSVYAIPQTHSWVSFGNDSLVSNRDDYLTAEGLCHVNARGWTGTIDDQMMTLSRTHTRTDQVAGVVGQDYTWGAFHGEAEGGALVDGNVGGNTVQNWYHASRGIHRVPYAYVERRRWFPILAASLDWTAGPFQVVASSVATPHMVHLRPEAAIGGDNARLSFGWLWNLGHEPSVVADAVDDNQKGPQLTLGGQSDHIAMSLQISGKALLWTLGLYF